MPNCYTPSPQPEGGASDTTELLKRAKKWTYCKLSYLIHLPSTYFGSSITLFQPGRGADYVHLSPPLDFHTFRRLWRYIHLHIFITPARTLSISGPKSQVLKLTFFNFKKMVKNVLDFFFKSTKPLQRYLLICLANSAFLGIFFALGSSNFEGAR